jgi:hypothetical protein
MCPLTERLWIGASHWRTSSSQSADMAVRTQNQSPQRLARQTLKFLHLALTIPIHFQADSPCTSKGLMNRANLVLWIDMREKVHLYIPTHKSNFCRSAEACLPRSLCGPSLCIMTTCFLCYGIIPPFAFREWRKFGLWLLKERADIFCHGNCRFNASETVRCVCVYLLVCVLCVWERLSLCVGVYVCVWVLERERLRVCVRESDWACVCLHFFVCVCMCVCESPLEVKWHLNKG